jgi:hypothetical protein
MELFSLTLPLLTSKLSFTYDLWQYINVLVNRSGDVAQKHLVRGVLLNFNTIEAFKECDKSALIHKFGQQLEQSWTESSNEEAPQFFLISFAVRTKLVYFKITF